jgi:cell division protein FtsB
MNLEFIKKCVSSLKGNKWLYISLLALVFACIMFLVGWNIGYSSYNELLVEYKNLTNLTQTLQNNYDELREEYTTLRTDYIRILDELNQLTRKDEKVASEPKIKSIIYEHYGWLKTAEVRWITVMLGKGDRFEGLIVISTKVGTGTDWYYEKGGEIIFEIREPNNITKLIDAGRIQDEYSFEFVAEESGNYRLVFNDPTYKSRVELYYNSPTIITDLDVMR